jgi:uncharacterized protein YuzB (UPF0349 family)
MTNPQSQLSEVLWEITHEFCHRIIVIDGEIKWVSAIRRSHLFVKRLWLPSPIKVICSESVSDNQLIKSVVIENMSQLKIIESNAFIKTSLQFLRIPDSVEVLGEECFAQCGSLSSVTFESGSRLKRIEKRTFTESRLVDIIIPASVEVLDYQCFARCRSLSSVTFESGSKINGRFVSGFFTELDMILATKLNM